MGIRLRWRREVAATLALLLIILAVTLWPTQPISYEIQKNNKPTRLDKDMEMNDTLKVYEPYDDYEDPQPPPEEVSEAHYVAMPELEFVKRALVRDLGPRA